MFDDIVDQVKKVIVGLEKGISAAAESIPLLVRQEIDIRAMQKLDTTKDEFMNGLDSEYQGSVYVVDINPDNWIANAVENGVSSFDMKEKLLKSKKAKVSQKGYRYLRVPLPQTKSGKPANTVEGQKLQSKIREALNKPNFGREKLKINSDGTVSLMEQIQSTDPDVKGLYRVQRYASSEAYKRGDRAKATQFVLFRTVSERPDAKGQWQHPGIHAAKIFPDVQIWCDSILPQILSSMIDRAVEEELKN